MSLQEQFKGVQGSQPLDTNAIAATTKANRVESGHGANDQLRISYGTVVEVSDETSKVRINIVNSKGSSMRLGAGKDGKGEGIWVPILQPLHMIHKLFGSLRKGLIVRIFWRGRNAPSADAIAEVISDATIEEFRTGSQSPRSNELATQPHEIFTGGTGL